MAADALILIGTRTTNWHVCIRESEPAAPPPKAAMAVLQELMEVISRGESGQRPIMPHRVSLWDIFFTLRGSIIRVVAWRVALLTLIACAVVYWTKHHGNPLANFGPEPFTFIGISISVFMSFRNSACFDRWWEARKQWGRFIIAMRSLARETLEVVPDEERKRILLAACAYAYALKARLRGQDEKAAARHCPELTDSLDGSNISNQLLDRIGRELSRLAQRGLISEWRYMLLETRLNEFTEVQGACERIKNTPLPFAYSLLIHRTTYMFCCLLPFGLAAHLGWDTPILVAVVSYTFFGIDAIGDELEDPFGENYNDLPLNNIVQTIEHELMEAANS